MGFLDKIREVAEEMERLAATEEAARLERMNQELLRQMELTGLDQPGQWGHVAWLAIRGVIARLSPASPPAVQGASAGWYTRAIPEASGATDTASTADTGSSTGAPSGHRVLIDAFGSAPGHDSQGDPGPSSRPLRRALVGRPPQGAKNPGGAAGLAT